MRGRGREDWGREKEKRAQRAPKKVGKGEGPGGREEREEGTRRSAARRPRGEGEGGQGESPRGRRTREGGGRGGETGG